MNYGLLFLWCFAAVVVLGYMGCFWPALGWCWRMVHPRNSKQVEVEVGQEQPYELRYKLGDMRLSWTFEHPTHRDHFLVGFREGLEYQLEALYRQGILTEPHHMQYGPIKLPIAGECR